MAGETTATEIIKLPANFGDMSPDIQRCWLLDNALATAGDDIDALAAIASQETADAPVWENLDRIAVDDGRGPQDRIYAASVTARSGRQNADAAWKVGFNLLEESSFHSGDLRTALERLLAGETDIARLEEAQAYVEESGHTSGWSNKSTLLLPVAQAFVGAGYSEGHGLGEKLDASDRVELVITQARALVQAGHFPAANHLLNTLGSEDWLRGQFSIGLVGRNVDGWEHIAYELREPRVFSPAGRVDIVRGLLRANEPKLATELAETIPFHSGKEDEIDYRTEAMLAMVDYHIEAGDEALAIEALRLLQTNMQALQQYSIARQTTLHATADSRANFEITQAAVDALNAAEGRWAQIRALRDPADAAAFLEGITFLGDIPETKAELRMQARADLALTLARRGHIVQAAEQAAAITHPEMQALQSLTFSELARIVREREQYDRRRSRGGAVGQVAADPIVSD